MVGPTRFGVLFSAIKQESTKPIFNYPPSLLAGTIDHAGPDIQRRRTQGMAHARQSPPAIMALGRQKPANSLKAKHQKQYGDRGCDRQRH